MVFQSLAGLPAFLVYFCTAIIAVTAYLVVYTRITPHNEFQLIRDNDPAAAVALGLSLLGFSLPVVSAIAHAANVLDGLIWSVIALVVQIIEACGPPSPGMAASALPQTNAACTSHGSSIGGYGRSSRFSLFGYSAKRSSSDAEAGAVTRGGFGSFAHAFGFSGRS